MRIVQLLPTLSTGDAVSGDARALQALLRRWDPRTEIYAENISPELPAGTARPVSRLPALGREDVLLYHMSIGSDVSLRIDELPCRKVMIYHNITPPAFFEPGSREAALCEKGLRELRRLRSSFDYCLADSDFNRQGLREAGYTCPIDVRPVLFSPEGKDGAADEHTLERYGDGRTNILFVGRVAPNKKQEDVIAAFGAYQRLYDPSARLILAGGGLPGYEKRLRRYVRALGLRNVRFAGHISDEELRALYRRASAFLCMSEHEGFCVPLLEAMYFDVPVLAFAAGAVPETLGGSGLLVKKKEPRETAALLRRLLRDGALRASVLEGQRRRLRELSPAETEKRFLRLFEDFLRRERPPRRPVLWQLVPVLRRGDAVSNDVLALREALASAEPREDVWTWECPDELLRSSVRCTETEPALSKEDAGIFHMAMGSPMAERFAALPCRKILVYHNITPPAYFEPYSSAIAAGCRMGLRQTERLIPRMELCLADSAFNAGELRKMGAERVEVLPILIPFEDYGGKPDGYTLRKYGDGRTNILFVGRVVPNKRFEDVIAAFACYQRHFDPSARLILAGDRETVPDYVRRLETWAKRLGAENVIFTGKIPFPELLALYRRASAFLCMSEHEGFCVPLLEAMYFDVPVIARAAAAVPETLGGSGVLLPDGEPERAAAALRALLSGEELRESVLAGQRQRLRDFTHERVLERAREIFGEVLRG